MAAITVGIRPSTVPSPIPVIPASVCILMKLLRSEWTGIISSPLILISSRGSAKAEALFTGCAARLRSLASSPPKPMAAVFIQVRRECAIEGSPDGIVGKGYHLHDDNVILHILVS